MKIHIVYDSKFSFSSMKDGENYLQSMQALKKGEDKTKVGFIKSKNSFLKNVAELNQRFPHYDYRPIAKDTVLGLLCRLIGDVRRLSDIPPTPHPILDIKDCITFEEDESKKQFQSEVMLLHTPEKEVQGSACGLITKPHCFADSNPLSLSLFSVFNARTLQDIKVLYQKMQNLDPSILNDVYQGPIYPYRLIEEMKFFKDLSKNETSKQFLSSFLPHTKINNIGGILLTEKIAYLKKMQMFVKELNFPNNVTLKGCIAGISSISGGLTPKDYYIKFVEEKKKSWTMPYQVKTSQDFYDAADQKDFNLGASVGIIKECGELTITIDRPKDECEKLYEQIMAASVQTFHMGKKGLAYILNIEF